MKKYRVVICGTQYGQVYLSAFLARNSYFQLAGIMGKGSARTLQYAKEFGVPLYKSVSEIPSDIDIENQVAQLLKADFRTFYQYVHRSLTRKILVFELSGY